MTADAQTRPSGRFRVLLTCGVFEPGFKAGGPIRSIARIVDTISTETELTLITSDRDLGCREPYPNMSGRWISRGPSKVFYLNTRKVLQWTNLARTLRSTPPDILYVNSLWAPAFSIVPVLAVRLRIIDVGTVLIAPRGELSPGALSIKPLKKKIFLRWWIPVLQRLGAIWHASTELEAADIRRVNSDLRIEIVPDQTSLPAQPGDVGKPHKGPLKLVFISRISPMKNIDLVLQALTQMHEPADLDIYGPVEDTEYWLRCQETISKMPANISVRYCGELAPQDVRRTFAKYDAFAFPTRGENFGHVIAESLSASCPVICSDRTPWTELLDSGGGPVIRRLNPEALAGELSRLASLAPQERLDLRRKAGDAYRLWRECVSDENIVDRVRKKLDSEMQSNR